MIQLWHHFILPRKFITCFEITGYGDRDSLYGSGLTQLETDGTLCSKCLIEVISL